MGDLFGVLLTVLLLAANAFFVAAEFALISARRTAKATGSSSTGIPTCRN